ncbi:MAG: signal peptide protein [Candidatus Solibacter sp.]|nr:signal peptide protein [Candidatus Solibacter sp.]
MFKKLFKNRKGAALIEYGLLIGGIALISAGAVSLFGHKTSDIIGLTAAIIPGAHTDDNGPVISGKLIETTMQTGGGTNQGIGIDFAGIASATGDRLGANVAGSGSFAASNGVGGLVVEAK